MSDSLSLSAVDQAILIKITEQAGAITLRQHYAGLAMQALISTSFEPCMGGLDGYEPYMAKAAFKIADAMIEAGKQ